MTSGRSCRPQPRRGLWRCERWIDSNPTPSHDSLNTKIPTIILHICLDFAARSHSQARFLRLCLLFQNATDDDSSLLHPRSQLFCIVFDNMAFYTAYNSMPLALVHTPEHALSRSTSPHLGLVIPTSQRGGLSWHYPGRRARLRACCVERPTQRMLGFPPFLDILQERWRRSACSRARRHIFRSTPMHGCFRGTARIALPSPTFPFLYPPRPCVQHGLLLTFTFAPARRCPRCRCARQSRRARCLAHSRPTASRLRPRVASQPCPPPLQQSRRLHVRAHQARLRIRAVR